MRWAIRYLADEKGAGTVEFTVLVPVFVMLMLFFADAAVVWLTHSEMFNAARDVSRKMAVGEVTTEDEAREYAAEKVFLSDRTYTIDSDFGGEMRVSIAVSIGQAAIFGAWFRPILGESLLATAVTRREPVLIPDDSITSVPAAPIN